MNFTYADLASQIAKMTNEQKASNVTVFIPGIDESYLISAVEFAEEGCAIGGIFEDHPILILENED